MKTQFTLPQKSVKRTLFFASILMISMFTSNTMNAQETNSASQESIIKGMVSNEDGPLPGTNIVLKGTKIGTTTDINGEFTFPKAVKQNDVLVISYLGYEKQEIKITGETSFIKLMLTSDIIEFTGALNSNKPYKSKRTE